MHIMNKLTNITFIDTQSIITYKEIIKKSCREIQIEIN